jgi:hypothetical protein
MGKRRVSLWSQGGTSSEVRLTGDVSKLRAKDFVMVRTDHLLTHALTHLFATY